MQIFMTGASGWVGRHVARELIAAGHQLRGIARSDGSAQAMAAAGLGVVRGTLSDLDVLEAEARAADAVIHCGFIHDFSAFAHSVAVDRAALMCFGAALAGSGKALVFTSGLAFPEAGGVSSEATAPAAKGFAAPRGETERMALAFASQGVRVSVVRLPPSVHGTGDHGFIAALIAIARQRGTASYIADGANTWPAVHVEDAARVYLGALERGEAGARYMAVGERGIPFAKIAGAIGAGLGLPVTSLPADQAEAEMGFFGHAAQFDVQGENPATRAAFGWAPTGPGLLEDLAAGHYFA